jgi:hypothetical protein
LRPASAGPTTRDWIAAMDVHQIKIDRAKLAAMPETERVLLLLLSHATNELNVLTKLILMMRKDDPPSPIIDHAEAGQTFIFMRLLIGKLHEAWELFRARVLTDRAMSTTLLPRLPSEAANALTALKNHFGRGSALTAIRNKVSFHYADKENLTEANFQQLAAAEPLQFYLTDTVGNCFYHAGELVAQLGVINLMKTPPAGPEDTSSTQARALNALCTDIIQVSDDMTELFRELIALLGKDVADSVSTETIPDGPKLSTLTLPYFVDYSRP